MQNFTQISGPSRELFYYLEMERLQKALPVMRILSIIWIRRYGNHPKNYIRHTNSYRMRQAHCSCPNKLKLKLLINWFNMRQGEMDFQSKGCHLGYLPRMRLVDLNNANKPKNAYANSTHTKRWQVLELPLCF